MNSVTARWMFYVQIIFLVLSLWLFPFFIAPLKAEPLLSKDTSAAALVIAASLQNAHGPVEYRPQDPHKVLAEGGKGMRGDHHKARLTAQENKPRNKVSYSGNLLAMNAKP